MFVGDVTGFPFTSSLLMPVVGFTVYKLHQLFEQVLQEPSQAIMDLRSLLLIRFFTLGGLGCLFLTWSILF